MKKNGWKVIPLLLALALAASFFGCSKKEKEDNMPTVGTKASVEQYTFCLLYTSPSPRDA